VYIAVHFDLQRIVGGIVVQEETGWMYGDHPFTQRWGWYDEYTLCCSAPTAPPVSPPVTAPVYPPVAPPVSPPTYPPTAPPGGISGDPHFSGFSQQKFDFHGQPDTVYNLISSPNIQVNTLFLGADRKLKAVKTYLGTIGIRIGASHKLFIGCDRANGARSILLDGKNLRVSSEGVYHLEDNAVVSRTSFDNDRTILTTPHFRISTRFSSSVYSTCHINVRALYTGHPDDKNIHGVLGQTIWNNKFVNGTGDNGEGVIQGIATDYKEKADDVFGGDYKFNYFTGKNPHWNGRDDHVDEVDEENQNVSMSGGAE
jgi:hypothetical protein